MYINLEVLFFIVGGISVFLWWYFRKSLKDGADSRKELLDAIKDLRLAIERLAENQVTLNNKLLTLQTQHDMVCKAGSIMASHHFVPSE